MTMKSRKNTEEDVGVPKSDRLMRARTFNCRCRPSAVRGVLDTIRPLISDDIINSLKNLRVFNFFDMPPYPQDNVLTLHILRCWDDRRSLFRLGGKEVKLSADHVALIVGMPNRGKPVIWKKIPSAAVDAREIKDQLSKFYSGASTTPFEELFLKFLISNLFFPSSNFSMPEGLLSFAENLQSFSSYNWPTALCDFLTDQVSIAAEKLRRNQSLGYIQGFLFLLTLWFYEHTTVLTPTAPDVRPRMLRWPTNSGLSATQIQRAFSRLEDAHVNDSFLDLNNEEFHLLSNPERGLPSPTLVLPHLETAVGPSYPRSHGVDTIMFSDVTPQSTYASPNKEFEIIVDLLRAQENMNMTLLESMKTQEKITTGLQELMKTQEKLTSSLQESMVVMNKQMRDLTTMFQRLERTKADKEVQGTLGTEQSSHQQDLPSSTRKRKLDSRGRSSPCKRKMKITLALEDSSGDEAVHTLYVEEQIVEISSESFVEDDAPTDDVALLENPDDVERTAIRAPSITDSPGSWGVHSLHEELALIRAAEESEDTVVDSEAPKGQQIFDIVDEENHEISHNPQTDDFIIVPRPPMEPLDYTARSIIPTEIQTIIDDCLDRYPGEMYPSSFKRMRLAEQIMDFTDPFAVARHIDELNEEKYGSATKEYEEVHAWRMKFINLLPPYLIKPCSNSEYQSLQISLTSNSQPSGLCKKMDLVQNGNKSLLGNVIELDSDSDADGVNPTFTQSYQYEKPIFTPVAVRQPPSIQYEKVSFGEKVEVQINKSPKSQLLTFQDNKDLASLSSSTKKEKKMKKIREKKKEKKEKDVEMEKKLNVSISPSIPLLLSSADHSPQVLHHNQDDVEITESDGLEDLWNDMSLAIEFSKDVEPSVPVEKEEECCHSFVLKDDLGIVCQVCGVVQKSIETIFDFQWAKNTRDTRYYVSGTRKHEDMDEAVDASHPNYPEEDTATDLGIDAQHRKLMKPHQIEGFRFLVKNLMVEKPGGCILAHAPGSGKTFMLISFMQSFITQKPNKRPLVVLPKGILATWKREFQLWQSEDIPLFDFYSSKADHRSQQLDILKNWEQSRGILFLGYKQFTNIVSSTSTERIDALCREKLLMVPGLVILDEGHTPRNNNTALVQSLSRIKTPRKVVLSGTLFQNHVKEVFNILKLVRPKFMKEESSRNVMKRILSSVEISASRRPSKGCRESTFCELIHETLQNDDNHLRKNLVIKDLREMTHNVLHYYKGDFLDELPGLVDFTVFLKLTSKQKNIMSKLHKLDIFKGNSVGSAVYLHPCLKEVAESVDGDKTESLSNDKVDCLIGSLNVRDGVKTKFFLRVLSLSESAGEKLLVFSRYILPLKFLERLVIQKKGWRLGKEVFMISGDSNPEDREWSMEKFNNSADARVLFGSIKACGEGISLIGASRILILDVHLNPSVTRQAIGRAFRPGQQRKVYTYRLVASDSPEEEHHNTSFKKEVISKLWFEYNDYSGHQEIDLHEVELTDTDDIFLENPALIEDIKCLYKR